MREERRGEEGGFGEGYGCWGMGEEGEGDDKGCEG